LFPIHLSSPAPRKTEAAKLLVDGAAQLGIVLGDEQIEAFFKYLEELQAWGSAINLIRRKDEREIILKDFLDSLTIIKYLPQGSSVVDIGSGAGFPGIPVKVIRDDLTVVLWEATRKKVYFLKNVVRQLALKKVSVYWSDGVEKENFLAHFDLAISRALSSLGKFASVGLPLIKKGGILLAMKGKKGEEELNNDFDMLESMSLNLAFLQRIRIPYLGHERVIIGLQKMN
jgi:16S rRNA (guanine527-N7)-methyltransferase